jgi:hypothetical protein
MSMNNTTAGYGRLASYFGDRSRISWGAVIAGAVVAMATTLMLSLIGVSFGGASYTMDAGASFGPGLWEIISLALGMALGGYVAARLCGTHSHLDGELHGITMWALATLIGAVLLAQALSNVIGAVVIPVAGPGPGGLGGISHPFASDYAPPLTIERYQQALGNNGDPTTMSPAEINDEINAIVGGGIVSGNLSDAARTRLIALVAAHWGITKEEAAHRVAQMENDARSAIVDQQKHMTAIADEASRASANGARLLFTTLSLGLLGALVGAWLGTRHKRILHPQEAHVAAPIVHTGPDQVVGVRSVAVYDDAGHLVTEYLRGVNFPVSKADLLRLARSSNVSQSVVHSIEGMAEGSYANANEVLRALGLVH